MIIGSFDYICEVVICLYDLWAGGILLWFYCLCSVNLPGINRKMPSCEIARRSVRAREFLKNSNKRKWMRGMWMRFVNFAIDRGLERSNHEVSVIERLKTRVI